MTGEGQDMSRVTFLQRALTMQQAVGQGRQLTVQQALGQGRQKTMQAGRLISSLKLKNLFAETEKSLSSVGGHNNPSIKECPGPRTTQAIENQWSDMKPHECTAVGAIPTYLSSAAHGPVPRGRHTRRWTARARTSYTPSFILTNEPDHF